LDSVTTSAVGFVNCSLVPEPTNYLKWQSTENTCDCALDAS